MNTSKLHKIFDDYEYPNHLNGLRLVNTCYACPEQYDVFAGDQKVGYLRLRHGWFYAACPDVDGKHVYEAHPQGDGLFDAEERLEYLTKATQAIRDWALEKGIIW